jgi:hypothetical protein
VKTSAKACWVAALVLCAGAGCFRLSDPVYAFKDIRAEEPTHDGRSLLLGSIVIEQWMVGDLDSVSLVRLGKEPTYYGANRVNLFRVFSKRTMKDGHFIIEVDPGVYELDSFSTSGWGQPRVWRARDEARKGSRMVITRPGVYDMGTIRVEKGEGWGNNYNLERVAESSPERQQIFARALAGTRWEQMVSAADREPAADDKSVKEHP